MKKWTLSLLCLCTVIASPALGAVNSMHSADGSVNTLFRIQLSGALSGAAPEEIDSISITGPNGPLGYARGDFIYIEINSWRGFYVVQSGPPQTGTYEFTIRSGQTSVTTSDTQGAIKTIPLPDINTFATQGNTFSWGLVDLPGTALYYIVQIIDSSGKTVVYAGNGMNLSSFEVPEGVLTPGQIYRWRVRVTDNPDWVAMDNEAISAYKDLSWAGVVGAFVRHRAYGDGTNTNHVQFQFKDGSGQNVTRSLTLSNVKVYDPSGEPVSLTDMTFSDVSVGTYNAQYGQWNYPPPSFDPYAFALFSEPLVTGTYVIEVNYNGGTYSKSAYFNALTTLPFVDPSSFALTKGSNNDLTWSWTTLGPGCQGTTYPFITAWSQGQMLGIFFFAVPNGQCINSLLLPASFVQTINAMSDEVRLNVMIRTTDNNNDAVSSPLILNQLAPPSLAEARGKVTDAVTGEPILGANVALTPGTTILVSQTDGTFWSSGISAGTYSAQVSADNYDSKTVSGIVLASGVPNQLNVSLTPYAPKVTSGAAAPSVVGNDGQGTTRLTVRVTHPSGLSSVGMVLADLSSIGGAPEQIFYDNGTHGDLTAGDGTYSCLATVAAGTKAKLYGLNVTAVDMAGKTGFGSISLNVTDKLSGTVQPSQSDTQRFDNALDRQTLNIHLDFMKTVSSLRAVKANCEILLTIRGPDDSLYGPYTVTDSIDIAIPNAPSGQWEYVTENQCDAALSYEIETSGSGTGLLVGRVVDGLTGVGVRGASINCNTGGSTVSLDQGYYSGVTVAGTGIVTTSKTGYQTNIKNGVHIKSGSTTNLNIQIVSQSAPAQAVPSRANLIHLLDPAEDPKPPAQPFSIKVSGSALEFNAIFPRYQQAVDLYLGFVPSSGAHAGKLFLIDESNSIVEFGGTFHAWKTASTQDESGQIPIPPEYPYGSYTLYSLVTTDSSSLANFDLGYFTTTPPQPPPLGQNETFIPNPTNEPNPLTQPLAADIRGGNLILNVHFPQQREPVSIFLAYLTPGGQLHLIKSDNTTGLFSETLWSWKEDVTGEVTAQVLSIPTNQLATGVYYFYSLATTDPVTLSHYDLIYFNVDVQPE